MYALRQTLLGTSEMTYEEAVLEIYRWQYDNTDSFYNGLITLFQKADTTNREKLFSAFPNLGSAYLDWCLAPFNGKALFIKHGLLDGEK